MVASGEVRLCNHFLPASMAHLDVYQLPYTWCCPKLSLSFSWDMCTHAHTHMCAHTHIQDSNLKAVMQDGSLSRRRVSLSMLFRSSGDGRRPPPAGRALCFPHCTASLLISSNQTLRDTPRVIRMASGQRSGRPVAQSRWPM